MDTGVAWEITSPNMPVPVRISMKKDGIGLSWLGKFSPMMISAEKILINIDLAMDSSKKY